MISTKLELLRWDTTKVIEMGDVVVMRAVRVHEFGGPEVLRLDEVPEPVAGPGQVVVGLTAADVIFLDTLLRSGWGGEFFPRNPPYVPGEGGAGHVLSVGEGVDPAWLGRHVVGHGSGAYAGQAVFSAEEIVEVPDGLDSPAAAALTHDGMTALNLARRAKIEKGEWVLVAAAAGGAVPSPRPGQPLGAGTGRWPRPAGSTGGSPAHRHRGGAGEVVVLVHGAAPGKGRVTCRPDFPAHLR